MVCTYKHWVPLVTICPVNHLPDFGFITIQSKKMIEIYALRHIIHSFAFRTMYMEDIVIGIRDELCKKYKLESFQFTITYSLLFNKIIIKL
jgi:NADPH-dependent 7-cyano-7-deazaguanine reductase QueF